MKEIIRNIKYFVAFTVLFSIMTGCGGSEMSNSTVKSDYPPLQSAIAKAEIMNIDGTSFKVEDKKGSVLLLNLWATWCGPCREEMPVLVQMQEDYKEKRFEVIGLNTDDEPTDLINKFSQQMKLNYTIAWASTQMQADMVNLSKFQGIPQTFIVDREGNLRGIFRGASETEIKGMKELVFKLVNEG